MNKKELKKKAESLKSQIKIHKGLAYLYLFAIIEKSKTDEFKAKTQQEKDIEKEIASQTFNKLIDDRVELEKEYQALIKTN
jgi:hypothetical protein